MSWWEKGVLVMKVVKFMAQLFRLEFKGMGSLYTSDRGETGDDSEKFVVGETILPPFFMGKNILLDIPRGPYSSSQEYIQARIQLARHTARKLDLGDEDDAEHFDDIQAVLSGIESLVPQLFPTTSTTTSSAEKTILSNCDISPTNILISPTPPNTLTALIDWKCVATFPRPSACAIPAFLNSPVRTEPPLYKESKDQGEVYRTNLAIHEKTCLRTFFLEEMRRIEPGWVRVWEEGRTQRDVCLVIKYCKDD